MNQRSNDTKPSNSAPPTEPVARRGFVAAALGAIGVAALAGCAKDAAAESTDSSREGLAGATSIQWVDTLAELRAFAGGTTATAINVAIVLGYWAPGDEGGGAFAWVSAAVSPAAPDDDAGTVVVPTGTYTGYWRRIFSGALDFAWFGAKESGATAGQDNVLALTRALKAIRRSGGGTLELSHLYPLGFPNWTGVAVGAIDNFSAITTPIHGLTIAGARQGAGFTFMSALQVASDVVNAGLKFLGCERLALRGLTLDGSANGASATGLAIGFVYLQSCIDVQVKDCRFTNGSFNSHFTLASVRCRSTRYEGNVFRNFGGVSIGYVNPGEVEEYCQISNNLFDTTTGPHNCLYTTIRNGVIAGNCFKSMSSGGLMLQTSSSGAEVPDATENVTITGNSFYDCAFAIRSDFGASPVPMKNIAVTGNVIERGGPATAIGLYPCDGVTVTGNVIRDFATPHAIQLLSASNVVMADNVIAWTKSEAPPNGAGILVATYSGNVTNVVIRGNSIVGLPYGILGGKDPGAAYTFDGLLIENNVIECRPLAGVVGYGLLLNENTSNVVVRGNRFGAGASHSMHLQSTSMLSGNQVVDISLAANITHYSEDQGRRTFKAASAPPSSLPLGIASWNVGDLVYNSAPVTGAPLGWVYTPAGWKGFGVIA